MNNTLDCHLYHECYGEHAHGYPQILIPLEQPLHIWIGSEEYEVTPKELCFIPPGLLHRCDFSGLLQVINIPKDEPELKNHVLLSYPLIVAIRDQITQLVELIQTELKQNPESRSVHHLYSYLYSKLMGNCASPSIRYISEFYHLPITISQLAKIESYNATYYSDWFKQQTGFSPSIYLRYIRINRAKELLEGMNYSVMDIAIMVGYSSNATFTRAFHNITGMTPKAYRERACAQRQNRPDAPAEFEAQGLRRTTG